MNRHMVEEQYKISRSDLKMNPRKMAELKSKCTCNFGTHCQIPLHKNCSRMCIFFFFLQFKR